MTVKQKLHISMDWLGGWPFEVATPSQAVEVAAAQGFRLRQVKTVGRRQGCNEFILVRDRNGVDVG